MVRFAILFHYLIELILDQALHFLELFFRRPNPACVQRFQHPLTIGEKQRAPHIKENEP
jgi:hypothetical protein